MDSALRRRFAFLRMPPLSGEALMKALASARGIEFAEWLKPSAEQLDALNGILRRAVGPDAELGHSYLFDVERPAASVEGAEVPSGTRRVFWIETRKAQGGSGNQIDLSGSEDSSYPLETAAGRRARKKQSRTDEFSVIFDGHEYNGNQIKYQASAPVWRLFLQGKTDEGSRLSSIARGCPHPWAPERTKVRVSFSAFFRELGWGPRVKYARCRQPNARCCTPSVRMLIERSRGRRAESLG